MAAEELGPDVGKLLGGLRQLQAEFGEEVADVEQQAPGAALESLEEAVAKAPADYRQYLEETLECYRHGLYKAAVLMVWSAVMEHMYATAAGHRGGIKEFEKANASRFGSMNKYREIKKRDDFLYLGERDFIQLGEDAGMFNRNARRKLHERLETRNLCGHPTKYTIGREETVIFIESLILNALTGSWLNWS